MNSAFSCPDGGEFLVEEPAGGFLTPESLGADTRAMADAAADFLRGVVLPAADRLQNQEPGLMRSLLSRAGSLGLMGLDVPAELGGLNLPKSATARIAEALAAEPSFAVSHNVHTSVATLPIVLFGTPAQKQRYLPKLASGEWVGAYALSEAQAGSDAMASRARARRTPDGYSLTGEKMWITNAAFADLFVVFAKIEDDPKLSAFLVERTASGLSIGKEEHKLGLKGSSTCRLILDSTPAPAANLIGGEGEGAKVALYTLNLGRFRIAASSVGQAKNLLAIAARYASQRIAFGKPISDMGLIQEKIACMASRIFACETMLYRLAGSLDSLFQLDVNCPDGPKPAEEYAIECAMLKVACTETLDYCADECLQIHGGYGYTEEFPAARAWRDARVNRIYEGANEINRLNIVQLLTRRIESGRLDLSRGPSLADSVPHSTEAFRAVTLAALDSARDALGPSLSENQHVCGVLADMLINLFAIESADIRSRRILEIGSSETRWQAARDASMLTRLRAEDQSRSGLANLFGALGPEYIENWRSAAPLVGLHPEPLFARQVALSRAVVDAGGYCW